MDCSKKQKTYFLIFSMTNPNLLYNIVSADFYDFCAFISATKVRGYYFRLILEHVYNHDQTLPL